MSLWVSLRSFLYTRIGLPKSSSTNLTSSVSKSIAPFLNFSLRSFFANSFKVFNSSKKIPAFFDLRIFIHHKHSREGVFGFIWVERTNVIRKYFWEHRDSTVHEIN